MVRSLQLYSRGLNDCSWLLLRWHGSDVLANEVCCFLHSQVVKLSAYKGIVVDTKVNQSIKDVKNLLEKGNILVGSFRLSMNYYKLRPGEIYVYDEKKPIKHPKSNLTASHAVMMIGIGQSKNPRYCFMGMQNSEGQRFGINGLGRVAVKSIKDLFQIELEKPAGGLEPF